MGGSNQNTQTGIYGTRNVASAGNLPGTHSYSVGWIDTSNNIWIFGGSGYDSSGVEDLLNDVWKYSASNGNWMWAAGSNFIDAAGAYGTKGTASTSNISGARSGSTNWIDGTDVWFFGGAGMDSSGNWGFLNDLWKYTPSTGNWTWVSGSSTQGQSGVYGTKGTGSTSNQPGGRDRAVSWDDGAGDFWIFGGHGFDSVGSNDALNDLWEYTVATGKWTWISGANTIDTSGTYGTKGTGSTSNTPGSRYQLASWIDSSGNLWLFGGLGPDSTGSWGYQNDLWEFTPSTKKWTWVAGSNVKNSSGTFGTKGTGSTSNVPSAREAPSFFKDSAGNFWLFGGNGLDSTGSSGELNDLWKFNPTTLAWTWVAGSNLANQTGVYGTKGTGSTNNFPGGREGALSWADSSGLVWLFGGSGLDGTSNGNRMTKLNDLWKFDPVSGQGTWTSGYSTNLQQGNHGTLGVGSTAYFPSARDTAQTWVDTSGNLYLFGGYGPDDQDNNIIAKRLADFWKYVPSTGQWILLAGSTTDGANAINGVYGTKGTGSTSNLPGGRSGGMSATDSAGNFWLFGGNGYDGAQAYGNLNDLWKYNPSNGQWTWVSGSSFANQTATYGTKGTGSTANIPGPRENAVSWLDSSGVFWLFGGYGKDSAGSIDYLNDLWKFNSANGQWTWVSGSNVAAASGAYGVQGTGNSGNTPGARENPVSWLDTSGNLWLFGGLGNDSIGNAGTMNDLWKFTVSSGQWTWVGGSNVVGAAGIYGTEGTGSASNIPGARYNSTAWVDGAGNLWLLGGNANDSTGTSVYANDLWKYNITANMWTWVAGASTGTPNGVYNNLGVQNRSSAPGGRQMHVSWRTSDGTIWLLGGQGNDAFGVPGYIADFWKLSP